MTRLITGLAALLSVLVFATGALAHASLVSSEPTDGSVVVQAPKMVQLHFNEPVTPAVIRLIDANGRSRDDAVVRAIGQTIVVTLPDRLPRGTQVLSYRVISEDGHPVAGSMVFSIGAATTASIEPGGAGSLNGLIWLARIGVYIGLFAGAGGAFFTCWIAPARAGSRVIVAALAIGVLSAVLSIGLQGLDLLDLPFANFLTQPPWKAALASSVGPSLLIAILAMVAGFVAQRSAAVGVARSLSLLAMVGIGVSLAASGHASTAQPQWLTRPAVFLHGVAVAFWVGALAPLAAMALHPTERLLPVLQRFSAVAVCMVGLLVLTGLTLSVVQLESLDAITETRYGQILSIKLILVAVLLGFAGVNRFLLTPAVAAVPSATRPLARSIIAECVVVVAILAVVAGWRFTPPPRAIAVSGITPLALHIHTDQAMFQVLVSPGRVGSNSFVLQLMNGDGTPLPAKEATLALSVPEHGIEALERKAMLGPDGYWHVRDVPLPAAGRWHMRIDALVTDFEKVTLEEDFELSARQEAVFGGAAPQSDRLARP